MNVMDPKSPVHPQLLQASPQAAAPHLQPMELELLLLPLLLPQRHQVLRNHQIKEHVLQPPQHVVQTLHAGADYAAVSGV